MLTSGYPAPQHPTYACCVRSERPGTASKPSDARCDWARVSISFGCGMKSTLQCVELNQDTVHKMCVCGSQAAKGRQWRRQWEIGGPREMNKGVDSETQPCALALVVGEPYRTTGSSQLPGSYPRRADFFHHDGRATWRLRELPRRVHLVSASGGETM